MDPKLANQDINGSAGDIAEIIDRIDFRVDTRETRYENEMLGASITAVEKKAFTLSKTLVYRKILRHASITEIHEALLCQTCTVVERAKLYTLIHYQNETVCEFA